jgi:hypothetical protein
MQKRSDPFIAERVISARFSDISGAIYRVKSFNKSKRENLCGLKLT